MSETFGAGFDPTPIYDTVPREIQISTGDVVDVMRRHPEALARAGLGHLVPFGVVYLGVTERAHDKLELGLPPEAGGFTRPDIVAKAIPHFGHQWLTHLLNYADGNFDEIPDVWMTAFSSPSMLGANPAIQFALPMGGHIDRDLGHTVDYLDAPADYHPDYSKHIGVILKDTAKAHDKDLLPVNPFVRYLLRAGVLGLISWKREVAWALGEQLLDSRGDEARRAKVDRQIEQYALLSGEAMLTMGDAALSQMMRFAPAIRRRSKSTNK